MTAETNEDDGVSCRGCGSAYTFDCRCDDDEDPGPHTCICVAVDDRDECEICGRDSNPFRGLGDEWDIDWDGRVSQ